MHKLRLLNNVYKEAGHQFCLTKNLTNWASGERAEHFALTSILATEKRRWSSGVIKTVRGAVLGAADATLSVLK